jgi:hypothetical protein
MQKSELPKYNRDKSKWIKYVRDILNPNGEFEPPLGTEQVLESVNCVCQDIETDSVFHPRREGLFCQSKIINADGRFGTDTGYYIEDEDGGIIKEFYSNEPLLFDSVKDAVTYLESRHTFQIGFDVRTKTHRHLLTEAFYI